MVFEFKFPDIGEGITEGEIVEWKVKEGDQVKEHDVLGRIETDKAVAEIPSPVSGTILKIHFKPGEMVKVGQTLITIGEKGEIAVKKQETKPLVKPAGVVGYLEEAPDVEEKKVITELKETLEIPQKVLATPATRRIAKEMNVEISQIKGTGKEGRVTEEDLKKTPQAELKVTKKYDLFGYVEHIPLRGIRKTVAKRMKESVQNIPHVVHMDEANVTELWRIREREKLKAETRGVKLTFLPFIVKAAIHALKDHPYLNSTLDDENNEIILKKYYNIGIAVDTPDGLMVPVIKGADEKSILEIAKEIEELAEKARLRTIDLGDLKGGTFTITNIGSVRGLHATPIINYPEAAILALGRIQDRLVSKEHKVHVAKILPLSLSFDHRILDGAEAARFMQTLIEHLEDPDLIMLDRD